MTLSRPILFRTLSALILSLTVVACGAAGATTPPANTPGAPSVTAASATAAATGTTPAASGTTPAATTAAAVTTASTTAAAGGLPDCSGGQIGRKAFTMSGFQAQRYCGPATASLTVAGTTTQFSSGWCETNAAGFAVSIGTQIFGSPSVSQEPDLFLVLVDPTTGDGPISGVANHHRFLLVTPPLTFGPGKTSGTFSGTGVVGGAISGSFACG